MAGSIPLLIDTDVALDDWMAILYLLNNPAIDLLGVTTTGVGAAHLTPGTRITQSVLLVGGQPQIPVARGTSAPLLYSNVYPGDFRQQVDSAYGLDLPQNTIPLQDASAADFLASTIAGSSSKVSVLALGGGTNLGTALQRQPELCRNIERIYVMGGVINSYQGTNTPGNVAGWSPDYTNQVAEWNIFVDPLGAQLVFQCGAPITMIPLNATNQVPLTTDFYDALQVFIESNQGRVPPAAKLVFDGLTTQLSTIKAGQYFFWDPLAAVVLARSICVTSTIQSAVAVQQALDEENDTSGQTLLAASGPPVDIVMGVDPVLVRMEFFAAITGGASFAEYREKAAAQGGAPTPG